MRRQVGRLTSIARQVLRTEFPFEKLLFSRDDDMHRC